MDFAGAYSLHNLIYIGQGLLTTLEIAVLAIITSFVLGVILGSVRYLRIPVLHYVVWLYVELIRNLPLLLIIFFTYFAVPRIPGVHIKFSPYAAALIAFTIFESALIAEIVRGGLNSIEKGQIEAARSQGFTYLQTLWYIVLPQALKRMIPAMVSQFITLVKDTSYAYIIGLAELTQNGKTVFAQSTAYVIPTLLLVTAVYFVINYTLSLVSRRLEKKLAG
ncbi:MAG: amino acid ABC transporter permease [Alicyclobacillaceae bacterium]|nr:amino acid ABC transporter permease [Alicyclobacillaceae bacterium]